MSGNLDIGPLQSGSGLDIGPLQSGGTTGGNITGLTGISSRVGFGSPGFVQFPTQNITGNTGIPTSEAFGSGGSLSIGILGKVGIPSRVAFGGGALIVNEENLSVFLAGVDVTNLMLVNPQSPGAGGIGGGASNSTGGTAMTINQYLTQASTFTAAFFDTAGVLLPIVGQELLVYKGTTRIFGGSVDQCTLGAYQAQPGRYSYVQGVDFSNLLDRRFVGRTYQTPAINFLTNIVSDIVNTYLSADGITYDDSNGDPGFATGPVLFNWITARQAFNQLSSIFGWDFSVDAYKVIRFFPQDTGVSAAPFNIADNDGNCLAETMSVRQYRGTYRNMQGVMSATQASNVWTDIFSVAQPGPFPNSPQPPNGVTTFFVTLYPIISLPVVAVNGVAQQVISIDDVGTTPIGAWDWYYIPDGNGVQQNWTETPLTSSDTLTVGYPTALTPIIWVSCNAQIAIRAALEGNSGVYQDVQQASSVTDPATLLAFATGLLNRYGCLNGIPVEVIYNTIKDGLTVGQLQTINTSEPLCPIPVPGIPSPSDVFQIIAITITDVDKTFLNYQVTADSGLLQAVNAAAFFANLVAATSQAQPANQVFVLLADRSKLSRYRKSRIAWRHPSPGVHRAGRARAPTKPDGVFQLGGREQRGSADPHQRQRHCADSGL